MTDKHNNQYVSIKKNVIKINLQQQEENNEVRMDEDINTNLIENFQEGQKGENAYSNQKNNENDISQNTNKNYVPQIFNENVFSFLYNSIPYKDYFSKYILCN